MDPVRLAIAWNWPRPWAHTPAALRLATLPVFLGALVSTLGFLVPMLLISLSFRAEMETWGGLESQVETTDYQTMVVVTVVLRTLVLLWLAAGTTAAWCRHLALGQEIGWRSALRVDRSMIVILATFFVLAGLYLIVSVVLAGIAGMFALSGDILTDVVGALLLGAFLPFALALPLSVRDLRFSLRGAWRLARPHWWRIATVVAVGIAPGVLLYEALAWLWGDGLGMALGHGTPLLPHILWHGSIVAVGIVAILLCAAGVACRLLNLLEKNSAS